MASFFENQPAAVSTAEQAFETHILRSEIKRVRIIAYLLVALFLVVFVLATFTRSLIGSENLQYWQLRYALFTLAAAIVYEIAAFMAFRYFLNRGTPVPMSHRFANAFIETSIPTFMILAFTDLVYPLEALYSPPTYAYFFFIMLSTLRLQYRLSIFTGIVAAVQYAALVIYFQPELSNYQVSANATLETGVALAMPAFHIAKVFMFIAAGVVAGYVARELRQGFLESLGSVEERNRVIEMFGAHVSPEVVDKLLEQKTDLESETRHVCVMFLDIRNFTAFSEQRSPAEVVRYLNQVFDFMIDCVNNNRGIINKFLGDGFMAVFGAPISDGRDSRNALQAALDILEALDKWNSSGMIPETRIGIGLHAGDAVTGNVGSSRRKEYTIIGDTVNVASRLEQMNKKIGSRLLVSDTVRRDAEQAGLEFTYQEIDPIQVRGRQEPVPVFRLD
ncbi:MAG: adenylate cyclase [Spirochaetaceae bacterium]|nr:adenylate cyclase [Spirochaetaceae bacterium]|tara:strand:- start:27296 stop:28639 length:1344 start_codon:yes stop_codon:yes gene_type:complete